MFVFRQELSAPVQPTFETVHVRWLQSMLMKPKPLTLKGVYASLRAIALTKGQGSTQRKQDLIKQLISRCRCAMFNA